MSQCCLCKYWMGRAGFHAEAKCTLHKIDTMATSSCLNWAQYVEEDQDTDALCLVCLEKLELRDYGTPTSPVFWWCPNCKEER